MPTMIKLYDFENGRGGRSVGVALDDGSDLAIDNAVGLILAAYPGRDVELSIFEGPQDVERGAWWARVMILARADDIEVYYRDPEIARALAM